MIRAATDPLIGVVIAGRYEVVRKIAKGGMGTIYEVKNTRLGKTFALKTLTAEAAQDPEVLARFRREAEVVAKLTHPCIVEVVDWDTLDDGSPFLVMEYLRGENLSNRLRVDGPLPWPSLARISDQVLAALAVAHRAGVVHRDLKPHNVFLTIDDDGAERVKLLDFGISKLRDSQTFATTDARVLGTPAYMAPEQAEGHHDEIGPATDVWAVGAILFEMATGKVAFDAPSTPAILYRVCHGEAASLLELRPDAPPGLVSLIKRTLTRDIGERPSDIELVRAELRKSLDGFEGVTWPEPLRKRKPGEGTRLQSSPIAPPTEPVVPAMSPSGMMRATTTPAGGAPVTPADATIIDRSRPAPKAAPRPAWWKIAAAIALFAGAAALAFALTRDTSSAASSAPPAPAASPTTGTAPIGPAPRPAPPVAPSVEPPTQPPSEPPVAPPADFVKVHITSTPSKADVYRLPSELKVGTTPWDTELERADGVAVFIVKKAGHTDQRVEIDMRTGGSFDAKLESAVVRSTPGRTKKPPRDRTGTGRRKGDPINPFP